MAKKRTPRLVTKDSLQTLLNNPDKEFVRRVVGKALVHLLDRQTAEEQNAEDTFEHNGIGFTGTDGRLGTKHAKFYKRNNHIDDWAVQIWTKKNSKGYSRIAKYHLQLNEEAKMKKVADAKKEIQRIKETL